MEQQKQQQENENGNSIIKKQIVPATQFIKSIGGFSYDYFFGSTQTQQLTGAAELTQFNCRCWIVRACMMMRAH